jgi:carboxyl-terminal processing protease
LIRRPLLALLLSLSLLAASLPPPCRAAEAPAAPPPVAPPPAAAPTAVTPPGPPVEKQVESILAKLRKPALDDMRTAQQQLQQLGAAAVPALRASLPKARPAQQIALARALAALGQPADAVAPLAALVRSKDDPELAAIAARLLGEPPINDLQAAEDELARLVEDKSLPPDLQRAVARSLGLSASSLESVKTANATLRRLLMAAGDPDTRRECALALGEIDDFAPPVDAVLQELQDEPTARGRLARALLQVNTLRTLLIRPETRERDGINDRLLNEVQKLMQEYHVEPALPTSKLANAAAKGMVAAVNSGDHPDPHSSYFDEDDWQKFREALTGHYAGIGAVVQFAKHFDTGDLPVFTVFQPNYEGPGYKAGLRSFDRIVEVEGHPTAIQRADEAMKKLKDLVDLLRGKAGTAVELTVTTPGSKERRTVKVVRADIDLPTVYHKMLPGRIGYLRLTTFGPWSARDLEKALRDLEQQGMLALLFDLRNDPGGQLNIAVEIADAFLKDNKLICYTEGRNPKIAPREEFRTKDSTSHPDYPMVVLVNEHSASASEIVAGALQDYHRAVILGTTTFGKGSVQKLFPLNATAGRSGLKLTIAKYYLPSGRSIHGKGVEPDVKVELDDTITRREFDQLRESGAFYRYTATRFAANKPLFAQLAEFDGADTARYPDFDAWHKGLAGEIGHDKARRLLRAWLRLLVADDRGREFICDTEEDEQLQAAILEVAKRVPEIQPKQIPEYRIFATKPPKPAKNGDHAAAKGEDDTP